MMSRLRRGGRRLIRALHSRRVAVLKVVALVGLLFIISAAALAHFGLSFHGARSMRVKALTQAASARALWHDIIDGAGRGTSAATAPSGNDITWEHVMHDVAIVVKTGHEVSSKRLHSLREAGWMSVGRRVPNLLVVSDTNGPGLVGMKEYGRELLIASDAAAAAVERTVNFSVAANSSVDSKSIQDTIVARPRPKKWFSSRGWKGDKDKNLPAFHLLRTLYPGKKWYIMLDDDTYIFLDNFARFTRDHSSPEEVSTPFYTGKVFLIASCSEWGSHGENLITKDGPTATFAHGGSGIVLNGAAMDAMYTSIPDCIRSYSTCWAGDIQVALCLRRAGVVPRKYGKSFERHFTPFHPSHALGDSRYTRRWRSTERPITFHKAPIEQLRLLSEFERKCLGDRVPVVYATLLDFLLQRNVRPTFPKKKSPHDTHIFDKSYHHNK